MTGAEIAAEQFAAFRKLAAPDGRILRGRTQDDAGSYGGETFEMSDEMLRAHFAGDRTLGFCCAANGKARYLAFDIDAGFTGALPSIRCELVRRKLDNATLVTGGSDGSDGGRGKVVVFFKQPHPVATLQKLARCIFSEAMPSPGGQTEAGHTVDFYPLGGEGGLLRIGGRNRNPSRNATRCDAIVNLDGEPLSFSAIEPEARIWPRAGEHLPVEPRLTKWAKGLVQRGYQTRPRGDVLYQRDFPRLAKEYLHVYGAEGEAQFIAATEAIWARSPAMQARSVNHPRQDPRKNFERGRANAWQNARKHYNVSSPVGDVMFPFAREDNSERCSVSSRMFEGVKALYCFLTEKVRARQLSPDAFGASVRDAAPYLGLSPSGAWKRVNAAEKIGAIVVHDRGTKGPHGWPMILGLVRGDDTPANVRERGSTRPIVRKRVEARAKRQAARSETEPEPQAEKRVRERVAAAIVRPNRRRAPRSSASPAVATQALGKPQNKSCNSAIVSPAASRIA